MEHEGLLRGLAWLHPVWMLAGLWLALRAFRAGLELRRARLRGERGKAESRRGHVRLARAAVALVLLGFAGGPVSAVWLRDFRPFESFHAWLGVVAALLFAAAAAAGSALLRGRSRAAEVHGRLGAAALLAAGLAAVAGFVLLP